MAHFDETSLREARSIDAVTERQFRDVRAVVAVDLNGGADAWPAVQWLASTNDEHAKRSMIAELNGVLNGSSHDLLDHEAAVDNFATDVVFGRASLDRRRVGRAFDFVSALQASLHHESEAVIADLDFEETVSRRRRELEEHEARQQALTRMGVEPGKGLPFFELYMRRRRHKSWETPGD